MATVLERPTTQSNDRPEPELDAFLAALGDLSRRFGIAIGEGALLYIMDQEDYARSYAASAESELSFV